MDKFSLSDILTACVVLGIIIAALGLVWFSTFISPSPSPTPTPTPVIYGFVYDQTGEYIARGPLPSDAVESLLSDHQPGYANLTISSCVPTQHVGGGAYYSINCTYMLNDTYHKADIVDWYMTGGYDHITYAVRDGNYDLINQRYI